jgi:ethanolamine ammonia-lyase large subunit
MKRRTFVQSVLASTAIAAHPAMGVTSQGGVLSPALPGQDIFRYVQQHRGGFEAPLYLQLLGFANDYKEGDEIVGVAASSDVDRATARMLLGNTLVGDIDLHPPHRDELFRFIRPPTVGGEDTESPARWSLGQLKIFLLSQDQEGIRRIAASLSSDVIGCVVKLCTNAELIAIAKKLFNPLAGSTIGSANYLGARVQPNSPTDNVDDIAWQVFDAWSYGVGDVLLGTNPVSSESASVAAVQGVLRDILVTFQLEDTLPHCVLSHIDVQAEVEEQAVGSTALWFQSIAGNDDANATFDISVKKMADYARQRIGRYGLYFETGQGADFTNGHSHGFDMVLHESRKYGFARTLQSIVAEAAKTSTPQSTPWVHLNDVAGFIGPEVFRTPEQLVRCCLEDIVMGKLHGLCIGLDVCSTLHMDISLDDLDWCLDQIMPANPAYLMALPTKIDPMLGYLTTSYQDHVRLREKFGFRVADQMWEFFQGLGVIDAAGRPTKHFGDPNWVYLKYRQRRGDGRDERSILAEGKQRMKEVRDRGVFLADGHGAQPWDLKPGLGREIRAIYDAAKQSIWAEFDDQFTSQISARVELVTQAKDRNDYILHPESGESLAAAARGSLFDLKEKHAGVFTAQIVISDGLNALAIKNTGQLLPFLERLRKGLVEHGYNAAHENLLVRSGRVRAGYRIGELLFSNAGDAPRALLHIIGERPGTGHDTFSVYITMVPGKVWGKVGGVDHNLTKVVSGIALTALEPAKAADDVVRILNELHPV